MAGGGKKQRHGDLAQVLPDLVRAKGWEVRLEQYTLLGRWRELVDEDLAAFARPCRIDKGVLWLEVENSSWLQQFQYQTEELLATLNGCLHHSTLKGIRMVLPTAEVVEEIPGSSPAGLRFIKPDEAEVATFRRQVEGIADEQCREALVRLWYLSRACRRETI
jgi:hypothetical protein